ncbi:hypothetical protein ACEZCY_17045 [Streptacidiphilus sp. N1-12]|uniref:Uncharacterized protein n=2 Tax=Streptacidiphilus alkalitolerans TaxID=3342712 RepID=A0ABV6VAA5_9ACTN
MTARQLDLVEAPLGAGLAALERMRRRSRPTGPVTVCGDRLLVLLPPGSAADVPVLLHWLGWGHLEGVLVPRQRAAEPWMGLDGEPSTGAALRTEELPRILDTFADACARALLRGGISRSPSRTPHGPCSEPGRGR